MTSREHTIKFTTGEVAIMRALLERMVKSGRGGAITAADTALDKLKGIKLVDYNHVGRESSAATNGGRHPAPKSPVRRSQSGKVRGKGKNR